MIFSKNHKGPLRFFGLTGYYYRFIQNYRLIAQPLTQLLKKGEFQWSRKAQQAFEALKKALSFAHLLALPDFDLTFEMESDASSKGIGAILSQASQPIAYYNKALAHKH